MEGFIATPGKTRELLEKHNLQLYKGMGQNFLIDRNIIDIIISAADLKGDETVIEIGPGIGSLTQAILNNLSSGKLYAVEKDERFIQVLKEQFGHSNKLELINRDVLDINWRGFLEERDLSGDKVKVMANLPYYITTPTIMNLLESGFSFSRMIFMVQKEVAERMVAAPGSKDYGALSIAVQYYTQAEIMHIVPPSVFIPQPRVYSAIIALNPYTNPPVEVDSEEFFFKIIQAIFQQRRKNIKNALSKAANVDLAQDLVYDSLEEAGIDSRIRGEKLSIGDIARLCNIIWKKSGE